MTKKTNQTPDKNGFFGSFGGAYVAETLVTTHIEISETYHSLKKSKEFNADLQHYAKHFVGRPSPIYHAKNLSSYLGENIKLYFKREDLNHTGAHKINNCIGQILVAKAMGKTRIIAETGAGQHGVATATVCALFKMECVIFMGKKDIERQSPNVFRMKMLGAKIQSVSSGNQTLKDAMNAALRDWASNVDSTYYLVGTAAGPHPFPEMVRDFQSIIGKEAKEQILVEENSLPNTVIACIGGGSNAIGIMDSFIEDEDVNLIGVEAAGHGIDTEKTAASINSGKPGVLHGNCTYYLQDENGQIKDAHSISAGLDYPGIGPEHSYLHSIGRVKYTYATDSQALEAFQLCSKLEGIIPALEPSHALGYLINNKKSHKGEVILLNLCGRGDKDLETVFKALENE